MKKPVSIAIEYKKVYYINDEGLVEEIDKLIKSFDEEKKGGGLIQTLDGEDRPDKKPPTP
jgi:hypothetical protein